MRGLWYLKLRLTVSFIVDELKQSPVSYAVFIVEHLSRCTWYPTVTNGNTDISKVSTAIDLRL